ncbi:MAG: bifunctional demethylmenaquinone methyltransferase/2-methoxy-6-polyprenyl-1,4-benzoquinol methylase UbiE, partial [Bacteroidales bacterium]|nr:bifunctional demethylmenaquinone methyltransferase/2-methoxy-6-polyprenyl-1,4-benzoquinol methylase UbiE [Bacteroidales bacterium]
KKQQVRSMFNSIANRYDFLNHFLSAGIDYRWRKKAIKILAKNNPKTILDVATGTGDLAIAALKLNPIKVIGVDIAEDMVEIGKKKVREKKLEKIIHIQVGDSEDLQFNDNTFDAAIVAFGVRNFENLEKGLSEMYRVLNNNGIVMILEFSKPTTTPVRQFYQFYFKNILPLLGRIISGDNSAYTYLPRSVGEFPMGNEFLRILNKVGYTDTRHIPLTFGIASIYTGKKLK